MVKSCDGVMRPRLASGNLWFRVGTFLTMVLIWAYGFYMLFPGLGIADYLGMGQSLTNVHTVVFGWSAFIFFFIATRKNEIAQDKKDRYMSIGGWLMGLSGTGIFMGLVFEIVQKETYPLWISLGLFFGEVVLLATVAVPIMFPELNKKPY